MTSEQPSRMQLFVVDSYDASGHGGGTTAVPALPPGTRFAYVVHVPADDLVQALVEGVDEATVTAALAAAGWQVDRITPAAYAVPVVADGAP